MANNTTQQIIIRPQSIKVGLAENGSDAYEWLGIRSIKWEDVSPWVHIDIPAGPMLHQHIKSPHVEGTIEIIDLGTMFTALYNTTVNNDGGENHTAIEVSTGRKYPIRYCHIYLIDQNNQVVEYAVKDFRVNRIGIERVELGIEARYIIYFTADLVVKET